MGGQEFDFRHTIIIKKNISRTKLKGKLTEESTENENNAKKLQKVKKSFKVIYLPGSKVPVYPASLC